MSPLSTIKKNALELGFDACGVARCRVMREEISRLDRWLDRGHHAGMAYMERHKELRLDPAKLFEGTKSVIVCLVSYKTERTYPPGIPQIAAYARSEDYHFTVKERLNRLLERIKTAYPEAEGRAFVDSAPILEKSWAAEAGLGWNGRNSLLIHPELGSFCFIGVILTSLELAEYDEPFAENHCGICRQCIENCPAGAIREDRSIDAKRCLSYQTVENRNAIPEELLPLLGDRLFGCDTCQTSCPWNAKAAPRNHTVFKPDNTLFSITENDWLGMGSGEFKRRFGPTPLARAGLKKLKLTLRQKKIHP